MLRCWSDSGAVTAARRRDWLRRIAWSSEASPSPPVGPVGRRTDGVTAVWTRDRPWERHEATEPLCLVRARGNCHRARTLDRCLGLRARVTRSFRRPGSADVQAVDARDVTPRTDARPVSACDGHRLRLHRRTPSVGRSAARSPPLLADQPRRASRPLQTGRCDTTPNVGRASLVPRVSVRVLPGGRAG
jgi:hypothetical protein